MNEGSDQQSPTEPLRRAGAMQMAPGKPQFGCRAIEQFGNLMVHLGGVRTCGSAASVAGSTGNGRRRLAASYARRLGDAVDAAAFLFGRSEGEAELFLQGSRKEAANGMTLPARYARHLVD